MKTVDVKSFEEFQQYLDTHENAYLLIYKSGSDKSDCAFENLKAASEKTPKDTALLIVDVNQVSDIHTKYDIQTAPTLLEFENSQVKQIVKGCQSGDYYRSFFEHSIYSGSQDTKKTQKRVVVYSTPTCPHCNTLKQHLKRNQIPFRDVDVSKDQKMAQELVKKSGQQGVPQTEIDGRIVVGFNRAKIDEMLGIQA